jgi:hypothetical protein
MCGNWSLKICNCCGFSHVICVISSTLMMKRAVWNLYLTLWYLRFLLLWPWGLFVFWGVYTWCVVRQTDVSVWRKLLVVSIPITWHSITSHKTELLCLQTCLMILQIIVISTGQWSHFFFWGVTSPLCTDHNVKRVSVKTAMNTTKDLFLVWAVC